MSLTMEFKKDVSFINIMEDLETFVTAVSERLLIDITDEGTYPAITASGEFENEGVDADTLDGHTYDEFALATHNHNDKYLAIDNTDVYTPTASYHPATKKYVDDSTSQEYAPLDHDHDDEYLAIDNAVAYNPTTDYNPATKKYVDDIRLIYDSNLNNVVDVASSAPWAGITGKPSTFTPTAHNHSASEITSGSISASRGVISGSSTASFVRYNGITRSEGQLYGSTTDPISTTRMNYDGYFYVTKQFNTSFSDYADCIALKGEYTVEFLNRKIVSLDQEGNICLADLNSENVLGIVSDNFASLLGGSAEEVEDNKKLPIAMAGFVNIKASSSYVLETAIIGDYAVPAILGTAGYIPRHQLSQNLGKVVGMIIDKDFKNNEFKVKVMYM